MNEILMNGVELMLVGMGIVFLFLAMLVVAVNTMSAIISRFVQTPAPASTIALKPADHGEIEPNTVAAISTAIHKYRNQHKK